jgi:hypothetical protein
LNNLDINISKGKKGQKAQGDQTSEIKLTTAQIMIEQKIIKQKEYDKQEKLMNENIAAEFKIMMPFINNKIIDPYNIYFAKIKDIANNFWNYMMSIHDEAHDLQKKYLKIHRIYLL